jgi:hypothetical protein
MYMENIQNMFPKIRTFPKEEEKNDRMINNEMHIICVGVMHN